MDKIIDRTLIITIVGAESSGKSTLAMDLAQHFQCALIPEYSREYLSALDRPYVEEDLEIIAFHELERILTTVSERTVGNNVANEPILDPIDQISDEINLLIKSNISQPLSPKGEWITKISSESSFVNRQFKIIIVDGGMLTLRMWARIKFNMEIPVVEDALKDDITDLYILCRPRREWEPDPLREAPGILDRAWIYNQYLKALMAGSKKFIILPAMPVHNLSGG